MDIDLSSVDSFSSEVLVHFLWLDALIVEVGVGVDIETVDLSSNGLEKGRAAARKELAIVRSDGKAVF